MDGGKERGTEGGTGGRAESGGMAAKKLKPHTEMWGIIQLLLLLVVLVLFLLLPLLLLLLLLPGRFRLC